MMRFILFISLTAISVFATNTSNDMVEVFYDTPNLFLHKNHIILKYVATKNKTKKGKIKYDEKIIYISKNHTKTIFKVKHYNSVKTIEDKHPLLSLLKRKDRASFFNLLNQDAITYPMRLKYLYSTTTNQQKPDLESISFQLKFKYPYLAKLCYALFYASIGLFIIIILLYNKQLNPNCAIEN